VVGLPSSGFAKATALPTLFKIGFLSRKKKGNCIDAIFVKYLT